MGSRQWFVWGKANILAETIARSCEANLFRRVDVWNIDVQSVSIIYSLVMFMRGLSRHYVLGSLIKNPSCVTPLVLFSDSISVFILYMYVSARLPEPQESDVTTLTLIFSSFITPAVVFCPSLEELRRRLMPGKQRGLWKTKLHQMKWMQSSACPPFFPPLSVRPSHHPSESVGQERWPGRVIKWTDCSLKKREALCLWSSHMTAHLHASS